MESYWQVRLTYCGQFFCRNSWSKVIKCSVCCETMMTDRDWRQSSVFRENAKWEKKKRHLSWCLTNRIYAISWDAEYHCLLFFVPDISRTLHTASIRVHFSRFLSEKSNQLVKLPTLYQERLQIQLCLCSRRNKGKKEEVVGSSLSWIFWNTPLGDQVQRILEQSVSSLQSSRLR